MGNGNNRNRRGGARTRHGPHRGGAGNSANRSATHLMPSALRATEADEATSESVTLSEEAPANSVQPVAEEMDALPTAAVESAPVASEELPSEPESEASEPPAAEAPDEAAEPAPEPTPERPAPRGRFERFYAPGQGMRVERNGGKSTGEPGAAKSAPTPSEADVATGATGANQPRPSPEAIPNAHAPQVASAAHLSDADDDDASAPAAPREDVRGAVGGLIDSLHDLFTHDRSVASQGGISRCGICYLHFPANELTYREPEGFYVCESCGQALGVARVTMVRRQQRL